MDSRPLSPAERARLEAEGCAVPDDVKVTVCPPRTYALDKAELADWRSQTQRSYRAHQNLQKARQKNNEAQKRRAEERRAEYRAMFSAGKSLEEVAALMHVTYATVLRHAVELGHDFKHRPAYRCRKGEIARMRAMFKAGTSIGQIANTLGRDRKTVRRKLREAANA